MRLSISSFALVAASALLVGCSALPSSSSPTATASVPATPRVEVAPDPKPSPVQQAAAEFVIDPTDFSVAGPDAIPAGWTKLILRNDEQAPVFGSIVRLNDGVTQEAFQNAVQQGFDQAMGLVTMEGGPGAGPGATTEVWLNLREGQYFVMGPQGGSRPIVVRPAVGTTASAPASEGTIELNDFSFDLPSDIAAGRHTYDVVNRGQQPHEIIIARVAEGRTIDDLLAFFGEENPSGPPTSSPGGGPDGLKPGGEAVLTIELAPGTYYALCLIPDPGSHKAHVDLGMIKEFTVR